MIKQYFTFGQNHTHRYGNITLDYNSVVEIEAPDYATARIIMVYNFGDKWAFQYSSETMDMSYFPRGVVLRLGMKDANLD